MGSFRACGASSIRPVACSLLLAWGCSGPPGAGRVLGEDLGTFHVTASETTNTCGAGAFGSSERFEFDVDLSRDETELFWDGRVGGDVRGSLEFDFSARVRVDVPAARGRDPACTLTRQDRVLGVLLEDAAGSIASFEGRMLYDFEASDACAESDLPSLGLPPLPCAMHYALSAGRIRAPQP